MTPLQRIDPRLLTALLSLFASLAVTYTTPLTNTDGVLYLRTAQEFIQHGLHAAQALYDNPYYSVLIGTISNSTPFSPIQSAHILNAILCAIIGWVITDIGILIGGGKAVGYCTGALFLLHPQFNEYRGYIIRDFGFWACLLGFLNLQLRYYLSLKKHLLLLALTLPLIGSLFRVESVLFLALPIISLYPLRKHTSIIRKTFQLYSYICLACLALTIIVILSNIIEIATLTTPAERFIKIGGNLSQTLLNHELAFKSHLLNGYLEEYALPGVITAFIAIVLLKALKSFTLPYVIITVLMSKSITNLRVSNVRTAGIYSFLFFYSFLLISFTLGTTIIQGRHTLPLTLALIPILGSHLEHSLALFQITPKKRKNIKIIAGVFALYLFIDSFFSLGTPKAYLTNSINWLKERHSNCSIASNNTKVAYFSHLETNWKLTNRLVENPMTIDFPIKAVDIIAIEYHKKDDALKHIIRIASNTMSLLHVEESKKRGIRIYSSKENLNCTPKNIAK